MLNVRNEEGIIIAEFEHGKGNSITLETLRKLREVVKTADEDYAVKGIILTGAGRTFSSGFDLKMFLGFKDVDEVAAFLSEEDEILTELFMCKKPVVSAINGHAVAGGLIFAMATDYRIAKNHPKISLGMSEIKIGLPCRSPRPRSCASGSTATGSTGTSCTSARCSTSSRPVISASSTRSSKSGAHPPGKEDRHEVDRQPGPGVHQAQKGLKKPAADRIRSRLATEDWKPTLSCFFEKDVRGALEFVLAAMG